MDDDAPAIRTITRPEDEYTQLERHYLSYHFILQGTMTTTELARRLGMTPSGARRMLCRATRVVPIYQDENGWHVLE